MDVPSEVRRALASPGKQIGPYALLAELGRGGMGVVHRAWDTRKNEPVALKVLLDAGKGRATDRFEREGRAAGALRHEGIVSVLDQGVHAGRPYLVMELVEGESLDGLLRRGALTLARKLEVIRDVALALSHAHSHGVIHRDVKPSNVMIDRGGRARLMDFGLARSLGDHTLTATGQVLGTPLYMAPEQASGERETHGAAADVYSLGAVLYEMLAGRPPFQATELPGLYKKILVDVPAAPGKLAPGVPAALDALVLQCLEKEPARRPSARVVARALEAALAPRVLRRRSLLLPLGAGVLLGGVVLALALARPAPAPIRALSAHDFDLDELDAEKAIVRSTEELRLDPAAVVPLVRRGMARLAKGDLDGAVADATRAIEIDSKLGMAWYVRACARSRKRDLEGAIADATRAIELDPRRAMAWSFRGALRKGKGDLEGAFHDYAKAIELEPGRAMPWANRARARQETGDFQGAIDDATRAIAIDAGLAGAWYVRACARDRRKDRAGALGDLDRALALDPRLVGASAIRGQWRFEASDLDGALVDFAKATELDPGNASAWAWRGRIRFQKGDAAGAIEDSTRAIERDPRLATAWTVRGAASGAMNDLDGAIADSTRAIELDPNAAEAWMNRGVARIQKGDREGGFADCDRFLELAPDDPRTKKIRDDLAAARGR